MDGLTHSLVGLAAAKAGLERLSPYTAAACTIAANAPDVDVVAAVGGRWAALHYHRGITHSVIGTIALGVLIPTSFYLADKLLARIRRRSAKVQYGGLLLASLGASATHPLMDWTNNYGIRLLLPWSARWFYGDLVFIIDPYIWLLVGGLVFMLTSETRTKMMVWLILAAATTLFIFAAPAGAARGVGSLSAARIVWILGLLTFAIGRWARLQDRLGKWPARVALALVVMYWGGLAWQHRIAYARGLEVAQRVAAQRGEHLIRAAAMPVPANPFRWLCVAETDSAMYRFVVSSGRGEVRQSLEPERFEKPSGQAAELVTLASRDPRAQILLGFSRFPIERVADSDCLSQTLVEFADLRYTEPQAPARGNFALDVPVECQQEKAVK